MPVRRMHVRAVTQCDQIPAHPLTGLHAQHRQVAEDITIDTVEAVEVDGVGAGSEQRRIAESEPALGLVKVHEERDKLTVYILWGSVGAGFAVASDNQRADQPGVDVL